ncbi:MAG TPA: ribonuclease HII, partial [Rhizobiales bacterium]|nr:ribonuclease HII [Hyphomicrobiales bacterium]
MAARDSRKTVLPDFAIEQGYLSGGLTPVAGVDEAGRGPLAGPVVAAAVILDCNAIPAGLNDSKKLTQARREELFRIITATAQTAIGIISVDIIDRDNILAATMAAMKKAVENLGVPPAIALIDGNRAP